MVSLQKQMEKQEKQMENQQTVIESQQKQMESQQTQIEKQEKEIERLLKLVQAKVTEVEDWTPLKQLKQISLRKNHVFKNTVIMYNLSTYSKIYMYI